MKAGESYRPPAGDGAKGYLNGVQLGTVLLDRPALLIRALAPQQLLAMKLCAWRDDVDVADATMLLGALLGERAAVWSQIQPFLVPGRELKAKCGDEGSSRHRTS